MRVAGAMQSSVSASNLGTERLCVHCCWHHKAYPSATGSVRAITKDYRCGCRCHVLSPSCPCGRVGQNSVTVQYIDVLNGSFLLTASAYSALPRKYSARQSWEQNATQWVRPRKLALWSRLAFGLSHWVHFIGHSPFLSPRAPPRLAAPGREVRLVYEPRPFVTQSRLSPSDTVHSIG